ncbi:MAG: hypothetical protein B1H40_03635 [Candidatus Latescibacteria bacterium 4484_181]|nr:MAG: hypothetical protein B1H40_03635 [Candidatus Latescibacteria bacterium 4484_181]RKY68909.1 MAG: DUF2905 domain-containing protein [Candidatus Latescibacterota bacterium]RKY72772.1 MAG: DUF2905 domain-containing protein [Candidatus Latescibacterota bacterium]
MFSLSAIGKFIIIVGILLVITGMLIASVDKLPFLGRLPGDIFVRKGNFSFYFPVVTCLVLSVVLTILLNLFLRR